MCPALCSMLKSLLCFYFPIIVNFFFNTQTEKITISEIMFNPAGNENHNEFIEIFNYGEQTIDLNGWKITDGKGTDEITDAGMGTILRPDNFALILDKDYFGNSSLYDSLISDSALIITIDNGTFGSRGLSNSYPESLSIINAKGQVVSCYQYIIDNKEGYSEEKVILEQDNTPENWGNCVISGGTPGSKNSISPLSFNLSIVTMEIQPENPVITDRINASVTVKNSGISTVEGFSIIFFLDNNNNGNPEQEEMINNHFS